MTPYVIKKSLNIEKFEKYISNAQNTNQWSNNGWAVKELESRARDLLNIDPLKKAGESHLSQKQWGLQQVLFR